MLMNNNDELYCVLKEGDDVKKGVILMLSMYALLILCLSGCIESNEKLIKKGEYYQAYINYCEQSNEEKADECLLLWEKSILKKEFISFIEKRIVYIFNYRKIIKA